MPPMFSAFIPNSCVPGFLKRRSSFPQCVQIFAAKNKIFAEWPWFNILHIDQFKYKYYIYTMFSL